MAPPPGLTGPLDPLDPEVVANAGQLLKGWNHVTDVAARRLPTDLKRANFIRRYALYTLLGPPRVKR